jgi:hypothetical protein
MPAEEAVQIFTTAERLFSGKVKFDLQVIKKVVELSQGYPYVIQLLGKECINHSNVSGEYHIKESLFNNVLETVRRGQAFPTLENQYQKAIGNSSERQMLLHLLAEQPEDSAQYNDEVGRVFLKKVRAEAQEFDVNYVDQLIPRLVDVNYGPILERVDERPGLYEFVNPVFRIYVRLRYF